MRTSAFLFVFFCCLNIVNAEPLLRVGVSLPLSGPVAQFGDAVRKGIELAQKDHAMETAGVKFTFDDSLFSAKVAVTNFKKLKQNDLVFEWGSQPCMAVAPLAEKSHIPLLCFAGDPKPGFQYVFGFVNPAPDYAASIKKWIQKAGYHRVAIVSTEIGFLTTLAKVLKDNPGPGWTPVMMDSLPADTRDANSLVTRTLAAQPDVVVLLLLPDHVTPFVRQLRAQGGTMPLLGADTLSSPTLINADKKSFEGTVYVDLAMPDEFIRRYEEEFHSSENLTFAFNGYQLALFTGQLAAECGTPCTVEKRLAWLKADHGTSFPPYRKDETFGQYFRFSLEQRRITNGKAIRIKMP